MRTSHNLNSIPQWQPCPLHRPPAMPFHATRPRLVTPIGAGSRGQTICEARPPPGDQASDLHLLAAGAGFEPLAPSMGTRVKFRHGPGLPSGRGAVQLVRADAVPRWHSLPILLAACRAPGSCLANEWPTNDQRHDRRAWRSCHLPGTSLSGWPDLNRRPLRPEPSEPPNYWTRVAGDAAIEGHADSGGSGCGHQQQPATTTRPLVPDVISRRRVHTDHVPRVTSCR